jgi:hypothetical protein
MTDDELDDRFLPGVLAALRDYWEIGSFLNAKKGRREVYYDFIDGQIVLFAKAGRPTNDECLRVIVRLMLEGDRSYRYYLKGRGADEELIQTEPWAKLLDAGTGTVLWQYTKDREP